MKPSEKLLPEIKNRYSPLIFSDEAVSEETLMCMFEAARWAPSAFNEQPWRFIYALKNESTFPALFELLMPGNQDWVKSAAGLVLSVSHTKFSKNGKENRHYMHDVGLAVMNFTIQGMKEGVHVHQMSGFSVEKAREAFQLPEDVEPVTMFAFGYPGDKSQLEGKLRERAEGERTRKAMGEIVFKGSLKRLTMPE